MTHTGGLADSHRAVGKIENGTVAGLYAWSGMTVDGVKISDGAPDNENGLNLTCDGIKLDKSFSDIFAGCTEDAWENMGDKTLPTLKCVGGSQSGEMPSWIIKGDRVFSGSGTEADPFLIETAEELARMAELVNSGSTYTSGGVTKDYDNAYYRQEKDIDLAAYSRDKDNQDRAAPNGWKPIGVSGHSFKGVFDGKDGDGVQHRITGLYISRVNTDDQGLFGYASTAALKNIIVKDAQVFGNDNVGAVAGRNEFSADIPGLEISGCAMEGGSVSGVNNVGGVAGYTTANKLINCCATGEVSGKDNVGGVAGKTGSTTVVKSCCSTGGVNGAGDRVGGVAGSVNNNNTFNPGISSCYAAGVVSGSGSYVGGVAGYVEQGISGCYAAGNVDGGNYVGGVVGSANKIADCAALGQKILTDGSNKNRTAGNCTADAALTGTLSRLYAWNKMEINGTVTDDEQKGTDKLNGADMEYTGMFPNGALSPQFSAVFTGDISAWNTDGSGKLKDNELPTLKNMPELESCEQSGVLPVYITSGTEFNGGGTAENPFLDYNRQRACAYGGAC